MVWEYDAVKHLFTANNDDFVNQLRLIITKPECSIECLCDYAAPNMMRFDLFATATSSQPLLCKYCFQV